MANEKISRYPGIRSFETDERDLFFGRKKETQELFSLIKVQRSVVLFAKSGIGKTSLLNAGVIPLLTEDVYYPIKIRFQDTSVSPVETLRKAIESLAESVWLKKYGEERLGRLVKGREPILWEYLKAYSFNKKLNIVPILIFDQFEEFFMHSPEQQQPFIECLSNLIYFRTPKQILTEQAKLSTSDDDFFDLPDLSPISEEETEWQKPLDWKIILSLRSDRLSLLDNLSKAVPAILNNRYQLYPLKSEQAMDAIVLPSQLEEDFFLTPCFDYQPEALATIKDNLSNESGEIESFQLQIICQHIEHEISQQKNLTNGQRLQVDLSYLGGDGGIQNILNGYYEQRIALIGNVDEQLIARRLIEESLIVEGARVSLAETILLNRYRIPSELLARLQNTRLIRIENTHLGRAYEVSHDTLVAPILKSYQQRRELELRESEEKERLILLQKEAAIRKQSAANEAVMRKEIARQRSLIGAFLVLGVLLLILAGFASVQWQNANSKSQELTDKNKDLEKAKAKADSLLVKSLEANIAKEAAIKKRDDAMQGLMEAIKSENLKSELLRQEKGQTLQLNAELTEIERQRLINDGDVFMRAKEYKLALDRYLKAGAQDKIKLAQEAIK